VLCLCPVLPCAWPWPWPLLLSPQAKRSRRTSDVGASPPLPRSLGCGGGEAPPKGLLCGPLPSTPPARLPAVGACSRRRSAWVEAGRGRAFQDATGFSPPNQGPYFACILLLTATRFQRSTDSLGS
jgi:hypothetical protein